jgi:hypothetical protein
MYTAGWGRERAAVQQSSRLLATRGLSRGGQVCGLRAPRRQKAVALCLPPRHDALADMMCCNALFGFIVALCAVICQQGQLSNAQQSVPCLPAVSITKQQAS